MTLCAALLVFATALCYASLATANCDNDLIDGSAYRLSDQQFSASNSNASEPPHSARKTSGTSWCTEDLVVTDSPWLDVSFGVNVEIRALSTGGWPSVISSLFDDYVRSYQVQYAGEGEQHLRYVTEQDNTVPKVFGRAANPSMQRVQLPTPIIAERLRIIVIPGSWARARACMRVEAHGCLVPNTCPNGFQALSNDRTLLPLASINASSEEDDDPARDLVHTGDEEWCSDQSIESGPHILLDFTQPIVLTHMRSRGDNVAMGFSYVTEFSVQSSHNGSSLEQYQQPNGATTFSAPDHNPTVFTFWRPLTVNTTLRFNILGAVYNSLPLSDKDFCFNVELFGCLLTQANLTTHSILSTATSTSPSIYKPTSTLLPQLHVMASSSLGSQLRSSLDTTSIGQIALASLVTSSTPVSTWTGASTLATVSVTVDTTTVSVSVMVPLVAAGLLIAGVIAVIMFWRLRQRKQKKTGKSHVYFTVENQTLHGHDDKCTTSNPDSKKLNLREQISLHNPLELMCSMSSSSSPPLLILNQQLRLLDCIGQGEFVVVYKAHLLSDLGGGLKTVAVKTLKGYYSGDFQKNFLKESLKMEELKHPHVMNLLGVCLDAGPAPYIVLPYMGNGDLLSYLKKHRNSLLVTPEDDNDEVTAVGSKLLSMCQQISKGMEYLANQKIVHRDLAARNCMIDEAGVIKVADFGLSQSIYEQLYFRQDKSDSVKLPIKWLAIECMEDGVFSEKSDVWAFGVTCWEIFSGGKTPYGGLSPLCLLKLLKDGNRMEPPDNAACSVEIYRTVMQQCWHGNPDKRPAFTQLQTQISDMVTAVAGYMQISNIPPLYDDISDRCFEIKANHTVECTVETDSKAGFDMTKNTAYGTVVQCTVEADSKAGFDMTKNTAYGTAVECTVEADSKTGFDMTKNAAYGTAVQCSTGTVSDNYGDDDEYT